MNHDTQAAYERMRQVATGEIAHLFQGSCPDEVEGFQVRDPECPACQIIEQPVPAIPAN